MQATWKTALIKELNDVTALRALVGPRIYPAYLVDVRNPRYPCVNFFSEGGARRLFYVPFATMSVRFWAYSETNFEEAHDVFDLIITTMNGTILSSDENTMIFTLMAEADELHAENLRAVTAPFVVRKL